MAKMYRSYIHELRQNTAGLGVYNGGPGVNYEGAPHAYAVNVTLLHDPTVPQKRPPTYYAPSSEARILVVQRASGHGRIGAWSGISGYVDQPSLADPFRETAKNELQEEIGLTDAHLRTVTLRPGERFDFWRGATHMHIFPILGLCAVRPDLKLDRRELSDARWVAIGEARKVPGISNGYIGKTLPRALAAIGICYG